MNSKVVRYIVITSLIITIGVGVFLANKYIKGDSNEDEIEMLEIPLKVEELSVDFNINKLENNSVLEVQYTNNSRYDISKLVLEIKLKDSDESISLPIDKVVEAGKVSDKYNGKAPTSEKVEDVEILKYKISLSKGIYMEYDVESNQYNWS